jgi:signal transduction histidine kinase
MAARRLSWRRASLRARLTTGAAAIIALLLVSSAFLALELLHANALNSVDEAAGQRVNDLITLSGNIGRWPDPLPSAAGARVMYLQVVDSGGKVLTASSEIRDSPPLVPPEEGYSPVERTVTPADAWWSPDLEPYRVLTVPKWTAAGERVTVIAATGLGLTELEMATLRRVLLIACPLVLVLGVVSSWLLVGRSLRPVEAMRVQVAEISTQALDQRVPQPAGDDELGRLARTLNAMLDRLEQASDRQRRFVSDASHELRTPLTGIRAALEVAAAHPERAHWPRLTAAVLDESRRMERLIDHLLLLARSDEGAAGGVRVPVDLAAVVAAQAERPLPPGRTLALDATAPALVEGNADQLGRLVGNLLDNGLRWADRHVAVHLRAHDGQAELTVSDDGPGIPAADRERVFERFVRLEEDRSRRTGGFGLGLSIAREIARAHGGTVEVADDGPGATLVVRLPLLEPVAEPAALDRAAGQAQELPTEPAFSSPSGTLSESSETRS